MPFCRECGGQVEATCKFCPHCDSEQQSSVIIGNDSVHVGDITVNQVDEESLKRNLKQIFDEKMAKLAEIGFTKDSPPTKLTPSQEVEVEQVLEMSEQNDSVHVGDITVNQMDEESLKSSLKQIFDEKMAIVAEIGFTKDSSPTKLTPSQEVEVEQVLEMSEQLASHGIAIEPWHERATRWYKTKRGLLEAKHQLPVYRDGTVATMDSVYQERD